MINNNAEEEISMYDRLYDDFYKKIYCLYPYRYIRWFRIAEFLCLCMTILIVSVRSIKSGSDPNFDGVIVAGIFILLFEIPIEIIKRITDERLSRAILTYKMMLSLLHQYKIDYHDPEIIDHIKKHFDKSRRLNLNQPLVTVAVSVVTSISTIILTETIKAILSKVGIDQIIYTSWQIFSIFFALFALIIILYMFASEMMRPYKTARKLLLQMLDEAYVFDDLDNETLDDIEHLSKIEYDYKKRRAIWRMIK